VRPARGSNEQPAVRSGSCRLRLHLGTKFLGTLDMGTLDKRFASSLAPVAGGGSGVRQNRIRIPRFAPGETRPSSDAQISLKIERKRCPRICPRLHRTPRISAELPGLGRHKSPSNGFPKPFLSPETGVRIPVAVLRCRGAQALWRRLPCGRSHRP